MCAIIDMPHTVDVDACTAAVLLVKWNLLLLLVVAGANDADDSDHGW